VQSCLSVTISIFACLSFIDRPPISGRSLLRWRQRRRQEKSQNRRREQNPNATGGAI
jgi:hypothetical protein